MSELSGLATVNPPGRSKLGTVGPALPGVELRLADDGEMWCRGPLVMSGYRNEPEKTAEVIDAEGWLQTGDTPRSTTMATFASSTGRRTSSSTPRARTCHPPRSSPS